MSDAFLSGPEHDLPVYEGRSKTPYIICSTGRSGSTLLCALMRNTGMLGVPHEYLHFTKHGQPIIQRLNRSGKQRLTMEEYLDTIVRHRTSPNGVFGIKAHFNQLMPHIRDGLLQRYFGRMKYVFIHREDLLAQAISMTIASQTGKWTSHEETLVDPKFSFKAVEQSLRLVSGQNYLWERFFELNEISPHRISYEDLLGEPQTRIHQVAAFLGVSSHESMEVDLQSAGLKRQATSLNADWIEKFNSELKIQL